MGQEGKRLVFIMGKVRAKNGTYKVLSSLASLQRNHVLTRLPVGFAHEHVTYIPEFW